LILVIAVVLFQAVRTHIMTNWRTATHTPFTAQHTYR